MDYNKMTDRDIDARVLQAVYGNQATDKDIVQAWLRGGFKYTTNPADAWPIITEHGINLAFDKNEDEWVAWGDFAFDLAGWDMKEQPAEYEHNKNPLRAAMVVYLMMQEAK